MPYHGPHRMDEVPDTGDVTPALVRRAADGDDAAFGHLYDEWFERVFDAAARVVHDHAEAGDVAQDTFLRAWRSLGSLRDPELFGGWLLRIARNTALDHLERSSRAGAVDAEGLAMIERAGSASPTAPAGFGVEDRVGRADDPAAAVEDAEIVALVHESLEALDGRDAEVLDLGLRYDLTPAQIGEAVGLNRNAANQALHRARRRLRSAVEARVLWRGGSPRCELLADVLRVEGIERFDARAVAVVTAHAEHCEVCAEQRRLRLEPAALFAAVPLVSVPALKAKVAAALADAGVPMTGSSSGGAGGAATAGGATGGGDGASGATTGVDPSGTTTSADGPQAPAPDADDALLPVSPVEEGAPPPSTVRRGMVVAAGVAILLVIALGIALVARADDDDQVATRPVAPATTSAATTAPTTTLPPTTAPTTTVVPEAPPVPTTLPAQPAPEPTQPPQVAPPPPPPPPAVTASLTVVPLTTTRPWVMEQGDPKAPHLIWATENAASVTVTGPAGSLWTAPSGDVIVCPGGTSAPACFPPQGQHHYVLTARDAAGAVVATREVVLTVT